LPEPSLAKHRAAQCVSHLFYDAHYIANCFYLVDHHVVDFDASHLILDRNHQFKTIEPVGPKIVAEVRFIRQTAGSESKMVGDDSADFGGKAVIHGRSPLKKVTTNPRITSEQTITTTNFSFRNATRITNSPSVAKCSHLSGARQTVPPKRVAAVSFYTTKIEGEYRNDRCDAEHTSASLMSAVWVKLPTVG
jgi:hypothetical protein